MTTAPLIADISVPIPQPFLKWPGGKRRMAKDLQRHLPRGFKTYFEPFIGGGAMFFALRPKGSFISDLNPDVVNVYNVIKHKIGQFLERFGEHHLDAEAFKALRDQDRSPDFHKLSDVDRAIRFVKLNKTCFGGNMRYNKAGHLTIGYGHLGPRRFFKEENLLACHEQLRSTRIWSGCFSMVETLPKAGDLVFFDPPYAFAQGNRETSVIEYTREKFGMEMQTRLRDLCRDLSDRGVHIMVTNTDCQVVRDLYEGFTLEKVAAPYSISQNTGRRGLKHELLIKNFT